MEGCSHLDYSVGVGGDFTAYKYDDEATAVLTVAGVTFIKIRLLKGCASFPGLSQLCDWWSSCYLRVSTPAILLFPDCVSHCVLLAAGEQLAL